MKPDLETLKISDKELEILSGLDVGEIFIGGVFGGVCRSSVFHDPKRFFSLCLTEVFVCALVFIFTIPIGLFFIRDATAQGIRELAEIVRFLQIPFGITASLMIVWNIYLRLGGKKFQRLMHLLDQIDRYHEVIDAIAVLDQLETIGQSQVGLSDRDAVVEALRLTRDSLVAGLMTEKILRESQGLRSRQYTLINSIENNLAVLETMEFSHQASEYSQFLNTALEIGLSVHQEMRE